MTPKSFIRATRRHRRSFAAVLALLALGLFAAAGLAAQGGGHPSTQLERLLPPPPSTQVERLLSSPPAGTLAATALSKKAPPRKPAPRKQMPIPARISIPAIGVNARIIPLGRNRDGTIQVPSNFAQAGWFKPGPEPGERGAAVIVAHVDSRSGPGAFYRLRALRRGDVVTVHLRTTSRIRFVVTGSKAVPKRRFPTSFIYAKAGGPRLRLITCDGRFDSSSGHYVDNYIVFAKLITRKR